MHKIETWVVVAVEPKPKAGAAVLVAPKLVPKAVPTGLFAVCPKRPIC
jgi:hypothetical protein